MRAIARVALAVVSLALAPACVGAPPLEPCSEWDPAFARLAPPSIVAIELDASIGVFIANGTVVHSSAEHGTLVLTNAHVAEAVARYGGAVIHSPDVASATYRTFPVEPFFPDAAYLKSQAKTRDQNVRGNWKTDVALLRVDTRGALLPAAGFTAVDSLEAEGPFRAFPIYPSGKLECVEFREIHDPQETASREVHEGMSGSGIFNAHGTLFGLIWGGKNEGDPSGLDADVVPEDQVISWLLTNHLEWVAAPLDLSASVVKKAASVADESERRSALLAIVHGKTPAYHVQRLVAFLWLERTAPLEWREVEAIVRQERDRLLRTAALSSRLGKAPEADALTVELLSSGRADDESVALLAVQASGETPPRSAAALRATAADERRPEDVRVEAGRFALRAPGTSLADVPAALRDRVLHRALDGIEVFPAAAGTVSELCASLVERVKGRVRLDPDLDALGARRVSVEGSQESIHHRILRVFAAADRSAAVRLRFQDGVVQVTPR